MGVQQNTVDIAAINTWINSVVLNSKLPSELASKTSLTDSSEVSIMQKGVDDAEKIATGLLRGYQGTWNAQNNTPTIIDGVGIELDKFFIDTAGTQDLGSGDLNFSIGDRVEYINGVWYKRNGGGFSLSLNTGVITGGIVTENSGDNTKFDVSAGTGYILDWTVPSFPTSIELSWDAFVAIDIPDIGTEVFSVPYLIESATPGIAELELISGALPTPQDRRQKIQLQSLIHTNLTSITSVGTSYKPSYQVTEALLDYVLAIGTINSGNQVLENGANLQIDKAIGSSTLPFINALNDIENPAVKTNIAQIASTFTKSYQDGSGGFTFVTGNTEVDPDLWDDGSGVLATVSNNQFTIKHFLFFGVNEALSMTYGQEEYATLAGAKLAISTEIRNISPLLNSGVCTTVLIVKKGVTDLEAAIAGGEAEFLDCPNSGNSGGAASVGNFITQDTDQLTGNTGNKTLDGNWRFNNNLSLGATSPTYKLEIEDAGGDFIKLNRTSGDIGLWKIQISSSLGGGTGTLRFIPSVSTADFHVLSDGGASRFIVDTSTGNATVSGFYISGGFTVATLPAGITGATAHVTDALTPSYLGTAVGGGAVTVPVFFDGTNWIT